MELTQRLDGIPPIIWQELVKGVDQKDHPWRLPILGTVSHQGIEQRVVVLRRVFARERVIWVYTDRRSAKIEQLQQTTRASWLFYDHRQQWQLRAKGEWFYPGPEALQEEWRKLPAHARQAYAAELAPGSSIEEARDGVPGDFLKRTPEQTDAVFPNFAIIACRFDAMDWVQLHRSGNRRAQFSWDSENAQWKGQWLIP